MKIDVFGALWKVFPWLLVPFVMLALFLVVEKWLKDWLRGKHLKRPWPYRPRPVITEIEETLFKRLQEAFPHMVILTQVAFNRIVEFPNERRWLNILGGKSLDFVVCRKNSANILFVAELDDSSHFRKDRQNSDEVKNAVLEDAEIPLIRWNVRNLPDVAEIRETVRKRLTG